MEKNINNQKNKLFTMKNFMYFILIVIGIMLLGGNSVFAINQQELLNYQFEEGSGSIVVDSSPLNNIGIMTGATFTAQYQGKWGYYAIRTNTNDAQISTTLNENPNSTIVFSFWINPSTNSYDIPFSLYDTIDETHMGMVWDTNNAKSFYYYDSSNIYQEVNFENTYLGTNTWYHIVIEIDMQNQNILYYRNNVLIYNSTYINPIKYNVNETLKFRIGSDKWLSNDFQGYFDSFRIFDSLLTTNQISTLYNNNQVILETETIGGVTNYYNITNNNNYSIYTTYNITDIYNIQNDYNYNMTFNDYITNYIFNDTTVEHSIETTFIKSISPASIPQQTKVNFQSVLNKSGTCELYIDNQLEKTFYNILSYNYEKFFQSGTEHKYFEYCYYKIGGVTFYEISPEVSFDILNSTKAIEFYFYNINSENLLGEDYYFVTPCFEGLSKYQIFENQYYIKNIKNGYTQFNLSYTANYDFCLYRGNINYDENKDGFSKDFDIVDIKKTIPLGTIFVGEDTSTYNLKLTTSDIYSPSQPEFWGKTWETLFSLIVALIIGGIVIAIGIYAKIDKLVIVGGLIIMTGMGVSVWTFVGAIF